MMSEDQSDQRQAYDNKESPPPSPPPSQFQWWKDAECKQDGLLNARIQQALPRIRNICKLAAEERTDEDVALLRATVLDAMDEYAQDAIQILSDDEQDEVTLS